MSRRPVLSLAPDEIEHFIYIGLKAVGAIRRQDKGSWSAFDEHEVPIGVFSDESTAATAVLEAFHERAG